MRYWLSIFLLSSIVGGAQVTEARLAALGQSYLLPENELTFLKHNDFFDITDFNQTYFFDLSFDQLVVSDNYLHFYTQSRGATVNNHTLSKPPEDSFFSFDLSLYHELHICPLPKVILCFN